MLRDWIRRNIIEKNKDEFPSNQTNVYATPHHSLKKKMSKIKPVVNEKISIEAV